MVELIKVRCRQAWLWCARHHRIIGAAIAVGLVAATSYQLVQARRLAKDPVLQTAAQLKVLTVAIQDLETTVTGNPRPSKQATRHYLSLLQRINRSCQLVATQQLAASQELPETTSDRLKETNELCQDLSNLVKASQLVYQTTAPLMTANAKPRLYETLTPLSHHTRRRHEAAVKQAMATLDKQGTGQIDFPFAVKDELKTLQASIESSRGLGYMPALLTFQQRQLAERQQYWQTYASLPLLKKATVNQLNSYCQHANC